MAYIYLYKESYVYVLELIGLYTNKTKFSYTDNVYIKL